MRARLLAAAEAKKTLASCAGFTEAAEAALAQIVRTVGLSGVIRIFSDSESRWSAHHLSEEFVVRFKAGSVFSREDRPAINARQYSESDFKALEGLLQANRFDCAKDTLVVFAGSKKNPQLESLLKHAHTKSHAVVMIAPEQQSDLHQAAQYRLQIKSQDRAIIAPIQSVILHSICEAFEPEYDSQKNGFAASLSLSADLDALIASDDHLLNQILSSNAILSKAIAQGGTLFLAGNGGSTCDAIALAEHARTLKDINNKHFEILEMHAPDVLLCAYNDNHAPFARQIDANARAGDVLMLFSTSGNSQNLIDAVNFCKSRGVLTIALLGKGGGKLFSLCDQSVVVPSNETSRIQEAHSLIGPLLLAF